MPTLLQLIGSMTESPGGAVDEPPRGVTKDRPSRKPPTLVEPPDETVQTVFRNEGDSARWFNPELRFARDEVGSLLPLDQSTSFKLTARVKIPPLYSRGAIFAQAPVDRVGNGIWHDESTCFGVRGGRPFYEIGCVGSVDCDVVVNDDEWHEIAVVFDGQQYHQMVDGAFVPAVRSPSLESGNAKPCRAGEDCRALVGARVGDLLDASGRFPWHPRFDAETAAVAARMGPELPLDFLAWVTFEAPCTSVTTHTLRLPPLLSGGGERTDAVTDEPLREAVLSYPESSCEAPLLIVPRGYLSTSPLEVFAESLLEAICRVGVVEQDRPALLFEVGKSTTNRTFAPYNHLHESFRVEPPDADELDGSDGDGAVSRRAAADAQDKYESTLNDAERAARDASREPPVRDAAAFAENKAAVTHARKVLESRVSSLLASVMTTCDEAGAWVKFDNPFACNSLCSMICEDSPPSVVKLGLVMRHDEVWEARSNLYEEFAVFKDLYDTFEDRARSRELGAGAALPRIEVPMAAIVATCEKQRCRNFAPNPGLSHVVYFEANADLHRFNAALTTALQIPSGRFLVNGTNFALEACLETIAACRPVFCFKHTGGASRAVTHLLETRLKAGHNKPLALAPCCAICACARAPPAPGALCPHVTASTRVLSENWPEDWNPSSALVVDPLTQTAEQLQDRITAVMSSVFEGAGTELGGREAETMAIAHAWRLRAQLEKNASMQWRLALFLHTAVTFLTLLTVAAATYMAYASSDPRLGLLNLMLPAATAAAIGIAGNLKAVPKWAACRLATTQCEREVYRYRAQVGAYAPVLGPRTSKKRNPRRNFTVALKQICAELHASELKLGGLAAIGDAEADAARRGVEARETTHAKAWSTTHAKASGKVHPVMGGTAAAMETAAETAPHRGAPASGKLSAEAYIAVRHSEVLARYERSIGPLRVGVGLVDALAIVLTSSGTALVALGLVRLVPVLMALAAAVASVAQHAALGPKLRGAVEAIDTLQQLLWWWQGLTLIQKRNNVNKTFLVDMTEACVSHELAAFVNASLNAKPKKDHEDAEDADADAADKPADDRARRRRPATTSER